MVARGTRLTLPGKCFLFGEYAVLGRGPAILITIPPYFELIRKPKANSNNPFHPNSAAGMYWCQHQDFFNQWSYTFNDPYTGKSGFGRSSAEFAALYLHRALHINPNLDRFQIAWEARAAFQALYKGEKTVPSGIDIIAQIVDRPRGNLLFIDGEKKILQDKSGLPLGLDLFIVPTGTKLPTHEHLADFSVESIASEIKELNKLTHLAAEQLSGHIHTNFDDRDRSLKLGEALSQYSIVLERANLLANHSHHFLQKIRRIPGVIGAKGSGAMGADILVIAVHKSDKARFLEETKNLNLLNIFDYQEYKWLDRKP